MRSLYNKVNDRLFGSELPSVDIIKFDGSKKQFDVTYLIDGFTTTQLGGLVIGISETLSKQEKFNTLVHEMIHVWQAENGKAWNHGKIFKRWCRLAYQEFYE